MLKKIITFMVAACFATAAFAEVQIGQPAPAIEKTDANGNLFNLADHKNSLVVLEWHNHQCPFVVKFYKSGKMQELQKTYTDKGVKWVRVISSAPGKQGYVSAEEAIANAEEAGVHATATLLDSDGTIGKAYGAKTTPHMFVIDKAGNVVYAGAIDSIPTPDASKIAEAENYVVSALESLIAGEPVATATTQPYGCGVKY